MLEIINNTIKQKYTVLYHGTSKERLEKIKELGHLTEKNVLNGEYKTTKQTVSLTPNIDIATIYAKRANITKNEIPIILVFAVDTLLKNNINIYFFNNDVFLTDDIPANCILKTINLSK